MCLTLALALTRQACLTDLKARTKMISSKEEICTRLAGLGLGLGLGLGPTPTPIPTHTPIPTPYPKPYPYPYPLTR